jgi:Contractile injection system tube protein
VSLWWVLLKGIFKMPQELKIAKAKLQELDPKGKETGKPVDVQFNPETLKVSYANQVVPPASGARDQRGTSNIQFVGKGTTKLAVQLWFDATVHESEKDVRKLTEKVAYFMKPKEESRNRYSARGVRFLWGTFKFDGIVESMEESLEYFSSEGVPLRASISLNLTQSSFQFEFAQLNGQGATPPGAGQGVGGSAPPGTQPLTQAPQGSSLQGLSGGIGGNWQGIALANGIENPRLLAPGQLINLNASVGGGIGISGGAGIAGGASIGGGTAIGGSAGISGGGNIGGSAGISGNAGVSASGNISGSGNLSGSGSIG